MYTNVILFFGCLFVVANSLPLNNANLFSSEFNAENFVRQFNILNNGTPLVDQTSNGTFKEILVLLANSANSKTVIIVPFLSNTTVLMEDINFGNLTETIQREIGGKINSTQSNNTSAKYLGEILDLLGKQSGPVTIVPFIGNSSIIATNFNFGNLTQNLDITITNNSRKIEKKNVVEVQSNNSPLNGTLPQILNAFQMAGMKVIPIIQDVTLSWGSFTFGKQTENLSGNEEVDNLQTIVNFQTNYTVQAIKDLLGDKPTGVLIVPMILNSTIILDNFNFANFVQNVNVTEVA